MDGTRRAESALPLQTLRRVVSAEPNETQSYLKTTCVLVWNEVLSVCHLFPGILHTATQLHDQMLNRH